MPDEEVYISKIDDLKNEISITKKNKATNKHIGILRAKIAKARKELAQIKKTGGTGFFVRKNGDATVSLVGFPSSGKSSLINELTNISSKTAEYAFTTTSIIQGTMMYRGAHIQMLDLPGIMEYAHAGYGKGSTVIGQVRSSDLILFVVDVKNIHHLEILINELSSASIYVNRQQPRIRYTNTAGSHLRINTNRSGMDPLYIKEVFNGFGIYGGNVWIFDKVGEEELLSILLGRARYVNSIIALNKIDLDPSYMELLKQIEKAFGMKTVPVSATNSQNILMLRRAIYSKCDLIRVYIRPKENAPKSPLTMKHGSSVSDLARKIHSKLADDVKSAYVTGLSTKFPNQRVGSKHILKDGDIITLILER